VAFIHSGRHRKKGLVVLEPFTIDVVSDVVCPWCYIGKRRLEAALARLREAEPDLPVAVRWHPFQLNPDLPREGVDRRGYLEAKFGGHARAQEVYARVSAAGATVDIPFAFDAIERQPNTLDAHRLIAWAQSRREGDPDALVERLFRAYFVEGQFLGDREALVACAADAGYDADDALSFLASDELADAIAGADERARALGVSGVPFFVFGSKTALSGAHEPEALLDAIAQARAAG
jgi:predicted DsbA family dithiol-disulfide isomerase